MKIDQIAADLAFCVCVSNNDKFDLGVNTLQLYELNCVTGDTNWFFLYLIFIDLDQEYHLQCYLNQGNLNPTVTNFNPQKA